MYICIYIYTHTYIHIISWKCKCSTLWGVPPRIPELFSKALLESGWRYHNGLWALSHRSDSIQPYLLVLWTHVEVHPYLGWSPQLTSCEPAWSILKIHLKTLETILEPVYLPVFRMAQQKITRLRSRQDGLRFAQLWKSQPRGGGNYGGVGRRRGQFFRSSPAARWRSLDLPKVQLPPSHSRTRSLTYSLNILTPNHCCFLLLTSSFLSSFASQIWCQNRCPKKR